MGCWCQEDITAWSGGWRAGRSTDTRPEQPRRQSAAAAARPRRPLAPHHQLTAMPVHVLQPQRGDLPGAQPQPRPQAQHRVIAQPRGCRPVTGAKKPRDLRRRQGSREMAQRPARHSQDRRPAPPPVTPETWATWSAMTRPARHGADEHPSYTTPAADGDGSRWHPCRSQHLNRPGKDRNLNSVDSETEETPDDRRDRGRRRAAADRRGGLLGSPRLWSRTPWRASWMTIWAMPGTTGKPRWRQFPQRAPGQGRAHRGQAGGDWGAAGPGFLSALGRLVRVGAISSVLCAGGRHAGCGR